MKLPITEFYPNNSPRGHFRACCECTDYRRGKTGYGNKNGQMVEDGEKHIKFIEGGYR